MCDSDLLAPTRPLGPRVGCVRARVRSLSGCLFLESLDSWLGRIGGCGGHNLFPFPCPLSTATAVSIHHAHRDRLHGVRWFASVELRGVHVWERKVCDELSGVWNRGAPGSLWHGVATEVSGDAKIIWGFIRAFFELKNKNLLSLIIQKP